MIVTVAQIISLSFFFKSSGFQANPSFGDLCVPKCCIQKLLNLFEFH